MTPKPDTMPQHPRDMTDAQADYEARILAALEAAHHVSETPKSEHDNVNVLTAEARRVLVEATKAIENLPRRQENISGQTFSYVQLAEAVTAIRAIKEDEA